MKNRLQMAKKAKMTIKSVQFNLLFVSVRVHKLFVSCYFETVVSPS